MLAQGAGDRRRVRDGARRGEHHRGQADQARQLPPGPDAAARAEHHGGERADRQPGHQQTGQRLVIVGRQLLQRQRPGNARPEIEDAAASQQIKPPQPGRDQRHDEDPRPHAKHAGRSMSRRRLIAGLTLLWLAVGGFGVYSYGANYYLYRGFPPPRDPPGVQAGTLTSIKFRSAALGGTRSYDVYLPPGYAAAKSRGQRFAVMYLLHGSPGWPRLFINAGAAGVAMDTLLARHAITPFLIVMPDGRDGSFTSDTEWADTPHGRYESFVLEVVRSVDRRLPTIADRSHRLIAGNSEGAYAAANLGLRHLETFSALEAWSGYYRQTRTGVFKSATPAVLRGHSPTDYVRGLRARIAQLPVRAYLYVGAKDPDARQLAPFAAGLRAAGATVTTRVLGGRHDWRLWRAQTPTMLRWAAAAIAGGTQP